MAEEVGVDASTLEATAGDAIDECGGILVQESLKLNHFFSDFLLETRIEHKHLAHTCPPSQPIPLVVFIRSVPFWGSVAKEAPGEGRVKLNDSRKNEASWMHLTPLSPLPTP